MRIYIDCTDTYFGGLNTGIQRVVRSIVLYANSGISELGVDCQPVISHGGDYRTISSLEEFSVSRLGFRVRRKLNSLYVKCIALLVSHTRSPGLRRFLSAPRTDFGLARMLFSPFSLVWKVRYSAPLSKQIPSLPTSSLCQAGDILFFPDSGWTKYDRGSLERLKERGVKLVFFIHDIFPISHPWLFQKVHAEGFEKWFADVAVLADGLICNSVFSQTETLRKLVELNVPFPSEKVRSAYLGYDFVQPKRKRIGHAALRRAVAGESPCYLCVGTIEPRKDYRTVLDALDLYWNRKGQGRLILVGRYGWLCEDILMRIKNHPQFGKRLFWFDTVNDEDLSSCYEFASFQIIASLAEGFGLPLVEAMGHGVPVIASDIEVFREIASGYACFFTSQDATALAETMLRLEQDPRDKVRAQVNAFKWPNWQSASRNILKQVAEIG